VTAALHALERETYISLETFKRDGNGVRTPVWFARNGDALYVFTDGTSFKVKRISRSSKGKVAACNASGKSITSPWYDAKVEILEKGAEEDAAYVALRKKYGLQMKLLDVGSRLAGRIGRRKVIRITFPS
jgi:PPOX class probable F420-dependent enzyme